MAYISKEGFKRLIQLFHSVTVNQVLEMLDDMDEPDVVKVKHGEWDYIATHDCFSCNICKFDSDVVMKYCGGCGAKMDGGKI